LLDQVILWSFLVEALLKMGSKLPKPLEYFKDPWNCFDFLIVVICFLPYSGVIPEEAQFVQIFRLARLARTLRMITAFPQLRLIVGTIFKSIPSIFYISLLLLVVFYVFGVLGVFLFRDNDPVHFGDLGRAILSLFRVVTLEDWTDVMYTQIYGSDVYKFPFDGLSEFPAKKPMAQPLIATMYFISVVLLCSMIILNLFIGVVVNSMNILNEKPTSTGDGEISEIEFQNLENKINKIIAHLKIGEE
jgi:voltage-gated sodium channel